MGTLRSARALTGCAIHALDGDIGRACEFYFDDYRWVIRYLVADVGRWLLHKRVFLSPEALRRPDEARRVIPVSVTREQVRHSPRTDTDQPIAFQHQAQLHRHYGWEVYWGAEALIGSSDPTLFTLVEPTNAGGKPFDSHLRTTRVVTGHKVRANGELAGWVDDFLLDDEDWTIRHLVIRTKEGRRVLLAPDLVTRISFEESTVYLSIPEAMLSNSPPLTSVTVGEHRHFEHVA